MSNSTSNPNLDYPALVKFLLNPFLESPDALSIDCETANERQRVWLRLAFEGEDKGRVFGRGGRNLQAIRTVLATASAAAGQVVYLDIYEDQTDKHPRREGRENGDFSRRDDRRGGRNRDRRPASPRPSGKPRI